MSMKSVKQAVKKSKNRKDDFELGTTIRWVSADRFLYAAIKTPVGWATTARSYNTYVDEVLTFQGLLDVLARAETSDVCVSESWSEL